MHDMTATSSSESSIEEGGIFRRATELARLYCGFHSVSSTVHRKSKLETRPPRMRTIK